MTVQTNTLTTINGHKSNANNRDDNVEDEVASHSREKQDYEPMGYRFGSVWSANVAPINWLLGALGVQMGLGLWRPSA